MMILFSQPGCPFIQRVKIALGFKRVPVEEWQIDPAHPPREFRRMAPVGRVPVLLDGAVPIRQDERLFHWPLGPRPQEHPGLSDLGLQSKMLKREATFQLNLALSSSS